MLASHLLRHASGSFEPVRISERVPPFKRQAQPVTHLPRELSDEELRVERVKTSFALPAPSRTPKTFRSKPWPRYILAVAAITSTVCCRHGATKFLVKGEVTSVKTKSKQLAMNALCGLRNPKCFRRARRDFSSEWLVGFREKTMDRQVSRSLLRNGCAGGGG